MNDSSRGTFLALLALQDGPKHGYEVSTWIEARSRGFFTLSFGALYPILHKLEKEGLVTGAWEDAGEARRRKVYALTPAGQEAVAGERDRHAAQMAAFALLLGTT